MHVVTIYARKNSSNFSYHLYDLCSDRLNFVFKTLGAMYGLNQGSFSCCLLRQPSGSTLRGRGKGDLFVWPVSKWY
uniref:Uncharacterized protein n=1 Tax=Romanomermis culicivorax TaxID=13658 RepID=A0A915L0U7_ROMCU